MSPNVVIRCLNPVADLGVFGVRTCISWYAPRLIPFPTPFRTTNPAYLEVDGQAQP